MDFQKLPFLPLHFFYYQFTNGSKRLFVFVMMCVLLLAGLCLYTYHAPYSWAVEILEIAESQPQDMTVATVAAQYQQFPLKGALFQTWVNFAATPLQIGPAPLLIFWAAQLIAWALLLAAATFIRSRWNYFFYFLFGAFIKASHVAEQLLHTESLWVAFGFIMLFLGLAYMFQHYTLKWAFVYRFLIFLGMNALLFVGAWQRNGYVELQAMAASMYPLLCLMGLAFLVFIAKEPINLALFATTNHKKQSRRRPLYQILILFGLILAWELLLTLIYTDKISLKAFGIKPMHLLLLGAVFTIFTSQNRFHAFRDMLTTVTVFTMMMGAWAMLTLSFWFLLMAGGDAYFTMAVEEVGIILLFGVGIGQLFYLLLEFRDLLRNKVNLYYWVGQSGIKMTMVWLIGAVFFVLFQGSIGWRMNKLFPHSYSSQWGDYYFMANQFDKAAGYYTASIDGTTYQLGGKSFHLGGARFSPKPNYNLAAIYAQNQKIKEAVERYQYASRYLYFPYAILNGGNLLYLVKDAPSAKKLWNIDLREHRNEWAANNLAFIYLSENKPDSAILSMKKALSFNPRLSAGFGNMAEIYWRYDKKTEARKFSQAALSTGKLNKFAVANAILHQIQDTLDVKIPQLNLDKETHVALLTNFATYHLRRNENERALRLWTKTLEQYGDQRPVYAELLTALCMFRQDSVLQAASKIDFTAKQVSAKAADAYYIMGVAYTEKGVNEMARLSFGQMFWAGDSAGLLHLAVNEGLNSNVDTAFAHLSLLRGAGGKLREKVGKELALFYRSHGFDQTALTEYNGTFNRDDLMRSGIYADSSARFANALNAFRLVIGEDSTYDRPYSEMLHLYAKYASPEGESNAEYALKRFPESGEVLWAAAKLYRALNKTDKTRELLTRLNKLKANPYRYEALCMEAALSSQPEAAFPLLQTAAKLNPMRSQAYIQMAELHHKANKPQEGYETIYQALQYNTENADIWLYYTRFIRQFSNDISEVRHGAARAISLTQDPQKRAAIETELKDIIAPEGMGRSE